MNPKPIPVEEMKEYLTYDNGLLYWKKKPSAKVYVGDVAGRKDKLGYHVVWFKNQKYLVHRVVWGLNFGDTNLRVDHINGDKSDNRIENLREATTSQNTRNQPVRPIGVWKEGSWWVVRRQIEAKGKQVLLGRFETKEAAEWFTLSQNEVYFPGVYTQRG